MALPKRFFKIMVPGFHERLNLPQALCNILKQVNISDQAVVNTCEGTWELQVSRNEAGLICFTDGWPEFARRHGLNIGDFVLFESTQDVQEFNFKAFVFDTTACEKEFLESPRKTQTSSQVADHKQGKRQNPSFAITMKPYHGRKTSGVCIPPKFLRSSNVGNQTGLVLRDPGGRNWAVGPLFKYRGDYGLRVSKGWHDFYVGNNLKSGDVCVFELTTKSVGSTNVVMNVKILPRKPV